MRSRGTPGLPIGAPALIFSLVLLFSVPHPCLAGSAHEEYNKIQKEIDTHKKKLEHVKKREYSILTDEEKDKLIEKYNSTYREYPEDKCIHEFFEAQANQTPDAVAVICNKEVLTYRQLQQKSSILACQLQGMGVGPESLVAICAERSLEMVVAILGVLKSGGAYIPLEINGKHRTC